MIGTINGKFYRVDKNHNVIHTKPTKYTIQAKLHR